MLRIVVLAIAIGAGSLAAWLALSLRSDGPPVPAVAPPPSIAFTEEILVAASDLQLGQNLDETKLRWQSWPKDALQPSFVTRTTKPDAPVALKGAIVRSALVAGEPIRQDKLVTGSSGLLAALLPPGKRAVAIRVSAESTAGGLILPNDRVDVIQTMTRQGGNQNENLTRTLLNNIRVLAVDQKVEESKGDAAVVGKTVTLELTPTQTEIVASGQATGALSLALRSVADAEELSVATREASSTVRILRAGRSELVRTQ